MIFFFKKPEVVLDCFTTSDRVYEIAKINHASKYFPDWWKKTPKWDDDVRLPTIKHCVGFNDFFKSGIVIPSWFEMNIIVLPKNDASYIKWSCSNDMVQTDNCHPIQQFHKFSFSKTNIGNNFKINSPWKFRTKNLIHFTWTQPTWNQRDMISCMNILPGVMNFKYQFSTEINFLVTNDDKEKHITIYPLTPLVIMHPMTEKKVIIKTHLIDDREDKKIFSYSLDYTHYNHNEKGSYFPSNYKKRKKLIDQLDSMNECPFKKYD